MRHVNQKMLLAVLTLVLVLAGCSGETKQSPQTSQTTEGSEKTGGGELQYAMEASPPTLDPHMSGAGTTNSVARHIFESLVTVNSKFEVVPMLAKSWDISKDGQTIAFHLREGVTFHNGKEMVAEDVVASMKRWQEKANKISLNGAVWEAKDKYTAVLKLESPSLFVLSELAGAYQFAGIMPKEVINTATETGVKELIGTGPFKFVEWKQDQYIHLAKFAAYQSIDTPADGLAGKKEALIDDVYFQIVPDPSTRFAGLQTGEYDIGYGFEQDMYGQLKSNPNLKLYNPYVGYTSVIFNKAQGVFRNVKMRQAVNEALDSSKIAKASLVNNYRMNSSYMQQEQADWYSEAGSEQYNTPDKEKAMQLMRESGYKGETIKLLTTRDYSYMYNSAVVIKEQLEKAGMKVELGIYDWPTAMSMEGDPNKWDLEVMGFGTTSSPLEQWVYKSTNYGPMDKKSEALLAGIRTATSKAGAKKLWDELQRHSWEFLPLIKIADYTWLSASTDKVEGLTFFYGPVLWNTKVAK